MSAAPTAPARRCLTAPSRKISSDAPLTSAALAAERTLAWRKASTAAALAAASFFRPASLTAESNESTFSEGTLFRHIHFRQEPDPVFDGELLVLRRQHVSVLVRRIESQHQLTVFLQRKVGEDSFFELPFGMRAGRSESSLKLVLVNLCG